MAETITVERVDREAFKLEEVLSDGLAIAADRFIGGAFDPITDDEVANEAGLAWDAQVANPAIREVLPKIRDLIADAIERRLPWTWERVSEQ